MNPPRDEGAGARTPMSRRAMKRAMRIGAADGEYTGSIAFPAPPRADAQPASHGAPAHAPKQDAQTPSRAPVEAAQPRMTRPKRAVGADTVIAFGIAAVCFVVAAAIALRLLLGGGARPTGVQQPQPNTARTTAEAPEVANAGARAPEPIVAPEPPVARIADPMGLVRTLRQCARELADDPANAMRITESFTSALDSLSNAWCDLDRQALHAANEAVVEFLHVASRDEATARRVIERIGAGASRMSDATRMSAYDVWRSVWSVGMLARLSRERDLPAATLGLIDLRVRALERLSYGGDTLDPFTRGALGALWNAPDMIAGAQDDAGGAGAAEAWRRWLHAVDALHIADPRTNEALALRAATALLIAASRAGPDQETRNILTQLLRRADWSEAGDGRAALIGWLDDAERISTREADVVMRRLVDVASGAGIVQGDIFGEHAGAEQRARVRDRLAVAWGLAPTIASEGMRDHLVREARATLERPVPDTEGVLVSMRRAAALARLSEASARLWRHEIASARAILNDVAGPIDRVAAGATAQPSQRRAGRWSTDGEWAVRYLTARHNIAERRRVLGQLVGRTDPLGPVDAAVLVNASMFGSPSEIRAAALRIVDARSNEPTIVNAVLEELPRAPRVVAVARMVERVSGSPLPEVRDRAWPIAARRALVRRLLAMQGDDDDFAALDRLSEVIANAYSGWPAPSLDGGAVFTTDPAEAATHAWESVRAHGAAIAGLRRAADLGAIERRRTAALALANGPAQSFVANQHAIAETLAFIVAAERPELAGNAAAVVEALRVRTNDARDVFAQVASGERAILTLWLLRYGVEATP